MADRHRRRGRRAQPLGRQCASQGAGGAAAARAVAPGQSFRGARAGDAAFALPHPDAAAARRSRGRARRSLPRPDRRRTIPRIAAAAAAADGSVARALALLDAGALALRQQALDLLDRLPALDAKALHALGEALAGTDPQPLAAFVDTVNAWLSQRLSREQNALPRLARLAEAWRRVNRRRARRRNLQSGAKAAGFQRIRLACRGDARLIPTPNVREARICPASPITSPPRSPIRTARRISATPMRRSPPTRSRASCGSTAVTCSSSPAPTSTASKCCRRRPRKK